MDDPIVILRYRNTDESSIEAHRAIIDEKGRTLWGWWRKATENKQTSFIRKLNHRAPFVALLISPFDEEMCLARAHSVVTATSPDYDPDLVPAYYRDEMEIIEFFFLIEELDPVGFQPAIADAIARHDQTLFPYENQQIKVRQTLKLQPFTRKIPPCVVHLSDLHFGSDHHFITASTQKGRFEDRYTLAQALAGDLKSAGLDGKVGLVIVTGDITTRADWSKKTTEDAVSSLKSIAEALALSSIDQIVLVPGNHDIRRESNPIDYSHQKDYLAFLQKLYGRKPDGLNKLMTFQTDAFEIHVAGLDSTRVNNEASFTEYGFVGRDKFGPVMEALAAKENPSVKILALHHHLVPVSDLEKPDEHGGRAMSLTLDAGRILQSAQRAGVDIVLHGHMHEPRVTKIARASVIDRESLSLDRNMFILSGGSCGAHKEKLPDTVANTYNLIQLESTGATLDTREIYPSQGQGRSLMKLALACGPDA